MAGERSQSPSEALHKAMVQITSLRHSFPCKVGKILICADEVIEACIKQDREQFPFNLLLGEVDALAGFVRSEYDDLKAEADRRSSAYDLVLSLEHRFRLSIEFMAVNKIFESVEKRYERIDNVLPPRNYSLRELLEIISVQQLGAGTVRRLESAVNCFDRKEYKSVLRDCGEAGEALFGLYSELMSRFGCDDTQGSKGLPTIVSENGCQILETLIRRSFRLCQVVAQSGFCCRCSKLCTICEMRYLILQKRTIVFRSGNVRGGRSSQRPPSAPD
jgi:hypothetical protein